MQQTQAEAALEQAQARYQFSKSQLNNALRLSKNKSISKEQVDERESEAAAYAAEKTQQRAALNSAKRLTTKCVVRSLL